jgi:hypothetical protein
MKLKTITYEGDVKYLEVGFFSFMKCSVLTQIVFHILVGLVIVIFLRIII